MKIKDMPIGSMVSNEYFNKDRRFCDDIISRNIWIKLNDECDFIFADSSSHFSKVVYDAPEDSRDSDDRRAAIGWSYYPYSNIDGWLNNRGDKIILPSCPGDTIDDCYDINPTMNSVGFLDRFTDEQIEHLVPRELSVRVPTGYRDEFGETVTIQRLVALPSLSELGCFHPIFKDEGEYLGDQLPGVQFATRSSVFYSDRDERFAIARKKSTGWQNIPPYYDISNYLFPIVRFDPEYDTDSPSGSSEGGLSGVMRAFNNEEYWNIL